MTAKLPPGVKRANILARQRAWRAKNATRINADNRKKRAADPERNTGYQVKHKYGVTLEFLRGILAAQAGCCAICTTLIEFPAKFTHIDHDHKTGVVRGLLCRHCNTGLGLFREDRGTLLAALAYLTKHSEELT